MKGSAPFLFAATALSILYLGLALAMPKAGAVTPLEAVRWLQTDSLLSSYGTSLAIALPGAVLDPEGEFSPPGLIRAGGRDLAERPSLLPLLAAPAVTPLGARGGLLITGACVVLALAAALRLARIAFPPVGLPAPTAVLAGLGAVAATPLLVGGARFEEHILAAGIGALAFIPLVKSLSMEQEAGDPAIRSAPGALAAGLLLGGACWAAGCAVLLLPSILAAGIAVWGGRFLRERGIPLMAGAALPVAALLGWAAITRGDPTGLRAPDPDRLLEVAAARPTAFLLAVGLAALAALPPVRSRLRHRLAGPGLLALVCLLGMALLATGPAPALYRLWSGAESPEASGLEWLAAGAPALVLFPAALLTRRPAMPRPLRFLGLSGAIYLALAWLLVPATGISGGAGVLLPGWPLLGLFFVGLIPDAHGPRGGSAGAIVVTIALGLGLAIQLGSLRHLSSMRIAQSALASRIDAGTPEGSILLTDVEPLSWLLASADRTQAVFLVRPGADLNMLLGRAEQSGLRSVWVGEAQRGAGDAAGRTNGGGVDIGAGLLLIPGEAEAGTRGFSRIPEGD